MTNYKTPVYFAFGQHHAGIIDSDKKFFRKTIASYIDQLAEDQPAVVIAEHSQIALSLKSELDQRISKRYLIDLRDVDKVLHRKHGQAKKRAKARLIKTIQEDEALMNELYQQTIEQGNEFVSILDREWGYESVVQSVNQKQPGRIKVVCEPQQLEVLLLRIEKSDLDEKVHRSEEGQLCQTIHEQYLLKTIEYHLKRDQAVYQLTEQLAAENPERAIIIPRGAGHQPMVKKFFEFNSRFATTTTTKTFYSPFEELLSIAYEREPSEKEVKDLARKDWIYQTECNRNLNSAFYKFLITLGCSQLALRLAIYKATKKIANC